jgi:hypothetical protein
MSNSVRPYLSKTIGGIKTNSNPDEAFGSYKRAAGEQFVKLALGWTRRKDFFEKCKPSVANKRVAAASTPASTVSYLEDGDIKGSQTSRAVVVATKRKRRKLKKTRKQEPKKREPKQR